MEVRTTAASLVLALVLPGCIIVDGDGVSPSQDYTYGNSGSALGSVFGAEIGIDSIAFTVTSNGCTDESYFDVDVDRRSGETYTVALDRIEPDTCNVPMPSGVVVRYDLADLNIPETASVRVLNPVRRR
ncbi:MAG: hypothetical protein AAGJ32_00765 [Pseudomonadota bacterium]